MYQKLLKRRTVFVLGAGASVPYGFPTGPGLMQRLKEWSQSGVAKAKLSRLGNSSGDIDEFLDSLHLSSRFQTVDHFLEDMSDFRSMGSQAIALNLMPNENQTALLKTEDWYKDLFYGLGLDSETCAPIENLSIVTFNYDRSLEHFLSKNIAVSTPHKMRALARERLGKIKIVRAHGDLGEYQFPKYGPPENDDNAVMLAASRIRIVSDKLEDAEHFQEAQNLVSSAKIIIFLGFGYNERSLRALLNESGKNQQRALGTAVQLSDDQKARARAVIGRQMIFGGLGQTCRDFLAGFDLDKFPTGSA